MEGIYACLERAAISSELTICFNKIFNFFRHTIFRDFVIFRAIVLYNLRHVTKQK